ncbi:MAG: hypothetical protein IPO63_00755 [Bacteroidetes bacterium]|nr:hypothetical protein [Bacteroidota bacterium]
MNLLYNPTLTELTTLLEQSKNIKNEYFIVVEHDGEVLIEANSKSSNYLLLKYKFYLCGWREKATTDGIASKHLNYINQLFKKSNVLLGKKQTRGH